MIYFNKDMTNAKQFAFYGKISKQSQATTLKSKSFQNTSVK